MVPYHLVFPQISISAVTNPRENAKHDVIINQFFDSNKHFNS